jgi:outer membrane receptor protein involved in Fe transport
VLSTVPGWISIAAEGDQVELPLVRGNAQAMLLLRDGVSLFDPLLNIPTLSRSVPLENIKRIEIVTGPGGVLWGANSYLGVVNIITKDADDVGGRGFEVSAGYGDGRGDRQDFRAYALFGRSFFKDRLKVMLHASAETWLGPEYTGQPLLAASPAPQPPGPNLYGPGALTSSAVRSWFVNLDGKVTFGPLSLYGAYPIGDYNHGLGFSNLIIPPDLGRNKDSFNFFDRYIILEYKSRFLRDKFGLNAKGYYIQFNRDINSRLYPDSGLLATGFSFRVDDNHVRRYGATLDADFAGPWSWNRILVGGEVFHESIDTSHISISYPDAANVPLACPLRKLPDGTVGYVPNCPLVFTYAAERTVVGVFLADQIRPIPQVTLDGGVRYQQGFRGRDYGAQFLGSAAAVFQFLPDAHLKLSFSQGFRPPVFNNTDGNGAGVEFGGNPKLDVEHSESYQAEVNGRVLKNTRKVRELQLRADYSYTILDNLITLRNSVYTNGGKRGIHTVEALAKLYLNGDHALFASYTYLHVSTTDLGELRTVPNHWFTLGAVFNLLKDVLDVNANLQVLASYEDPNRVNGSPFPMLGGTPIAQARYTDLTFDRLPPVALLQLGARLRLWREHVALSAQFFNVLNQHFYYPDPFSDLAPTVEVKPTPAPGFSFFASLTYRP